MASRISAVCRLCCRGLPSRSVFNGGTRMYSSKATTNLLNCVEREMSLEQKVLEDLPSMSSFNVTLDGSMATLLRSYDNEEVKVQLDANSAIEVDPDEMESTEDGESFEDEEEKEPFSVPTFTVTVKNQSGTSMQFDCSFDEFGPYNEGMDIEWDCMRIDSVSVVPSEKGQVESVYSATSSSFSEELYSGLLEFLKERGINEKFSKEILQFYRVFEHQCYVNDFLGRLRQFCSGK